MSIFPAALLVQAETLLAQCREQKLKLTTAESCTGGLVAALLTEIPGSSDVFTHGFITYANEAKEEMIGVEAVLIQTHGAVSEQVARAMAEGALHTAHADIAIAITGIAGPGGQRPGKPVGTVHLACAVKGGATIHQHQQFPGNRAEVRMAAAAVAFGMLIAASAG